MKDSTLECLDCARMRLFAEPAECEHHSERPSTGCPYWIEQPRRARVIDLDTIREGLGVAHIPQSEIYVSLASVLSSRIDRPTESALLGSLMSSSTQLLRAVQAFVLRYAPMIRGTKEGDALLVISGLTDEQLDRAEWDSQYTADKCVKCGGSGILVPRKPEGVSIGTWRPEPYSCDCQNPCKSVGPPTSTFEMNVRNLGYPCQTISVKEAKNRQFNVLQQHTDKPEESEEAGS